MHIHTQIQELVQYSNTAWSGLSILAMACGDSNVQYKMPTRHSRALHACLIGRAVAGAMTPMLHVGINMALYTAAVINDSTPHSL